MWPRDHNRVQNYSDIISSPYAQQPLYIIFVSSIVNVNK
jgi:hypothetical protein